MKIPYLILLGAFSSASTFAQELPRPNIVWFLSEDLSPHYLASFQQGRGAKTPNVDRLAQEGITYTQAYCNAPVSSAARTTLITGCYTPSFGATMHRMIEPVPMPEGLHMFPAYLREAGYFTCNATKTDYNVLLDPTAWDQVKGKMGDWNNRKKADQPFFYMRSNTRSHESCLLFNEDTYRHVRTKTSLDSVFIHPYLPDTHMMRYTYATFYDRIAEADAELGQLVAQLQKEGELDNTFIFFFGDNGGSLPGSKGYTDDIGLRVPLVVYVPKNFRQDFKQALGTTSDRLVSFMDFAPTVLSLAQVKTPKLMEGKPFLGTYEQKAQQEVFGYGDRFGELYALNRVVRRGNYRYARNFQPYQPQGLYQDYRYKQMAFKEWQSLFEQQRLSPLQQNFFQPSGAEELYDVINDPYEQHNLVQDPRFSREIRKMRKILQDRLLERGDLGFFPECVVLDQALANPFAYAQSHRKELKSYLSLAELQLTDAGHATTPLSKALKSTDPIAQWWALTTIASFGERLGSLRDEVADLLDHPRSYIRSRALVALVQLGDKQERSAHILGMLKACHSGAETLQVLNDIAYLASEHQLKSFDIPKEEELHSTPGVKQRLQYISFHLAH